MQKNREIFMILFAVVVLVSLTVGIVSAAVVTQSINYQGKLTDAAGNPLNGPTSITFKLYSVLSGGTALDVKTQSVYCNNGLFTTPVTFDSGYFIGGARWVGISVNGDPEMTPRQEIRPVPYALSLRPGASIDGSGFNKALGLIKFDNDGSGLQSATYGTNSPAIQAQTVGPASKGVYAVTGGTGSHGVWGEATGPASNGVVAISQQSPALWAETMAANSAAILTRTTKDKSPGYSTNTYGTGSHGLYASTEGTESDGVRASTSGQWSAGVHASTSGQSSAGVFAYTEGADSDGMSASTSGTGSYGMSAATSGTGSHGMSAATSGTGSHGVRAYTSGFGSYGVYASTTNASSNGVSASTVGQWSNGVYASTEGAFSHGVFAYTTGPASYGVLAKSEQYAAIRAETDRSDNKYGVQTPDIIRALGYETGSSDIAEYIPVTGEVSPGTVIVIGADGILQTSNVAYDTKVAGIVSTAPGVSLGAKEEGNPGEEIVAVAGRVPCKVDATLYPIHAGDLLTTSDNPGYAMKSQQVNIGGVEIYRPGTTLGKAMGSLDSGTGTIEVLVTLQ